MNKNNIQSPKTLQRRRIEMLKHYEALRSKSLLFPVWAIWVFSASYSGIDPAPKQQYHEECSACI